MEHWTLATLLATTLHLLLVVAVTLRVALTRHPPGSSFAWILLVLTVPVIGLGAYLLFGERPLGRWREKRMREFASELPRWSARLPGADAANLQSDVPDVQALIRLAERVGLLPLVAGNRLQLLDDTQHILRRLIEDIERARQSVELEFYIWNLGGTADEVQAAVLRAAQRGVACRLLLDAQGSAHFFRSGAPAAMRAAGVQVAAALPVKIWQLPLVRADLRLHRKIALIDRQVAYSGSMNLVDPRFFKQDAGVGEWVDAMTRIEGPAVTALAMVFDFDWLLQTGQAPTADEVAVPTAAGDAGVCVVASGPYTDVNANLRLIVEAVSRARSRVLLTTPYFVPSEALSLALQNAAMRGVEVRLLVPERNDSPLVQYASRWHYEDLLAAGVRILQFRGGLLHTKSVTVDDRLALFGTVNLDLRSLNLNFELMLLVLDPDFVAALVSLQQSYEHDAIPVEAQSWRRRGRGQRLREGLANLVSPLL
jgi:cardiolipin synthase A/B